MNVEKMRQLRRVREIRRHSAERKLQEARRLVRRREAVVTNERQKLEQLQRECTDLTAAGRPDEAAAAGDLLLADHQLRKMRQRIANQKQAIEKAEQAHQQACKQRDKAASEHRRRQQKLEGIDSQMEKVRGSEQIEAQRRADDEIEELARGHSG